MNGRENGRTTTTTGGGEKPGLLRRGRRLLVAGALGTLGTVFQACFGKGAPTYDAGSNTDTGPAAETAPPAPDAGTTGG